MQPYKKKRKNPDDEDDHPKQKYTKKVQGCPSGFLCENLAFLGSCKKTHTDEEKRLSEEYQQIKKEKKIVVVLEGGRDGQGLKAISLKYPLIQLEMEESKIQAKIQTASDTNTEQQKDPKQQPKQEKKKQEPLKLLPGFYYEADYTGPNPQRKTLKIKILKPVCKFGDIKYQLDLIDKTRELQFKFPRAPDNAVLYTGHIKMNWDRVKVLKCSQGNNVHKPYYFTYDEEKDFPLTEGCTVRYTVGKGYKQSPKIYSVKHDKFKFTGILQIDKKGIFYVKCRNWRHESIDVTTIPQALTQKVKQIQQFLPYSLLHTHSASPNQVSCINSQLKKYLLKGIFNEWPEHFIHPIGTLDQEFTPLSLKSLKEAVIYEYMINPIKHSQSERKASVRLLEKLEKQEGKKMREPIKEFVFTIDGLGTSCHDDALSVRVVDSEEKEERKEELKQQSKQQGKQEEKKEEKKEWKLMEKEKNKEKEYEVGIHIADVDHYVPVSSPINAEVKKNDKTMYIKGYYNPMFYAPLMKFFSLSDGKNKLTYSLFFRINAQGLIDFKSIEFRPVCAKISKNYFHSPKLRQVKQLSQFFTVNDIITKSGLLSGLNEQGESEGAIDNFMLISSMIPTFMWKLNSKRIESAKKTVDQFVRKLIQQIKELIKVWEKEYKEIMDSEKQVAQLNLEKTKLKRKIEKEVDLEIKKLRDQLKQKKKQQRDQKKKQKKQKKQNEQQQSQSSGEQNQQEVDREKTIASISELAEKEKQLKELKEQEERLRKVKEALNKEVVIGKKKAEQDESESSSSESEPEVDGESERKKMSQAEAALKYLSKVFKILKVDIKWTDKREIRDKFDQAKKYDNSDLFKQYIKRMYILNHQHFRYIIKLEEKNQKQNQNQKRENNNEAERNQERQNTRNEPTRKKYKKVQNTDQKQEKKIQGGSKQQGTEVKKQETQRVQDSKDNQTKKQEQKKEEKKQRFKQKKEKPKQGEEKVEGGEKKEQKKEGQNVDKADKKEQKESKATRQAATHIKSDRIMVPLAEFKAEMSNKAIKQKGLEVGKQLFKKNNYDDLVFKLFSQRDESLIEGKVIQFEQSEGNELSEQLKTKCLKSVLIVIRSRYELKIPKDELKNRQLDAEKEAENLRNRFKNEQKMTDGQIINSEIPKISEPAFNNNFMEVYKNAMLVRKIRKLCSETQDNKKDEVKKEKPQQKEEKAEGEEKKEEKTKDNEQKNKKQRFNKKKNPQIVPQSEAVPQKKQQQQKKQNATDEIKEKTDINSQKSPEQLSQKQAKQQQIPSEAKLELKQKLTQADEAFVENKQITVLEKELNKQQCPPQILQLESKPSIAEHLQKEKEKVNEKKSKKMSEKKLIQAKKKQLILQLTEKYREEIKQIEEKASEKKKDVQNLKSEFKQNLIKVEDDYNIIDYMVEKLGKKKQKKGKKSKAQKKKNQIESEEQDAQDYSYLTKLCSIMDEYAKKSGHKFKIHKTSQLQKILNKKIDIGNNELSNIEQLNKEFRLLSKDQEMLLKWNNPIRSYDALQTMRLIKDYEWVFNGQLSPLDILIDYKALKEVKSRISAIQKAKIEKADSEQSDKKHKEANREIQKIEFFYKIKNQLDKPYKLLNVTSPSDKVKFVYHPSLGEIEVKNHNFQQDMFRVVEGKFEIVSEFPIEVKAVLMK